MDTIKLSCYKIETKLPICAFSLRVHQVDVTWSGEQSQQGEKKMEDNLKFVNQR